MILIPEKSDLNFYLQADARVDFYHPAIVRKAEELFAGCQDEEAAIRLGFEFVRDEIAHSADIQSHRITRRFMPRRIPPR